MWRRVESVKREDSGHRHTHQGVRMEVVRGDSGHRHTHEGVSIEVVRGAVVKDIIPIIPQVKLSQGEHARPAIFRR